MRIKQSFGILTLLVLLGAGCGGNLGSSGAANSGGTVQPSGASLDLSGRALTSVPSDVFRQTALEELNLSNNALTGALPSQIQQLRNLRVLNASGNRMTGVPAEIGQLSNLQDLDLSENALTGLPFELGNLQNLKRLDLRGNNVSKQDLDAIRAKLTRTEILE